MVVALRHLLSGFIARRCCAVVHGWLKKNDIKRQVKKKIVSI